MTAEQMTPQQYFEPLGTLSFGGDDTIRLSMADMQTIMHSLAEYSFSLRDKGCKETAKGVWVLRKRLELFTND